jgi:serine/threonine protein kinase
MVKKRGATRGRKGMKSRRTAKTRRVYRQRGGVFEGITYISQGADGATFRTNDDRLLKIVKQVRGLDREISVHQRLTSLELPYFPNFIESGQCINQGPINFTANALRPRTTICDAAEGNVGAYPYPYILMEYVEGGREFPKYLDAKIRALVPGLTRPLNDEEVSSLVDSILGTFAHLCFAFYVAAKVFNYRHNDFNERNCLIKPDGIPVIIDFGSNRMLNNNSVARNINRTGRNIVGYRNYIMNLRNYAEDIRPYIEQIKNNANLRRLISYNPNHEAAAKVEKLSTILESIRTRDPELAFNYQRTFSTLGIPQDLIDRGAQKIRDRVAIAAPPPEEVTFESQMAALAPLGFPENNMREAILAFPGNPQRQQDHLLRPRDPIVNVGANAGANVGLNANVAYLTAMGFNPNISLAAALQYPGNRQAQLNAVLR